MSVTRKDVEDIAELARLICNESELESLTVEINHILAHMEKLNELNTDNVEPLSSPVEAVNIFREDEHRQSIPTEYALKNAPDKGDSFFKVPKVINVD